MFLSCLNPCSGYICKKLLSDTSDSDITRSHLNWIYGSSVLRSHHFLKCTIEYIHHLLIHDALYSVKYLINGWNVKYTFHDFIYLCFFFFTTAAIINRLGTLMTVATASAKPEWFYIGCPTENECVNGHHDCMVNEECHDTPTSYQCRCKLGYERQP